MLNDLRLRPYPVRTIINNAYLLRHSLLRDLPALVSSTVANMAD